MLALVDRDVVLCIVCVYVCYVCVPRRRCILWQQCSNGRIGGVVRVLIAMLARERDNMVIGRLRTASIAAFMAWWWQLLYSVVEATN